LNLLYPCGCRDLVGEEEELAFAGHPHARIGSQDLLLLRFGFKWDLGEESRTERTLIFMVRSKAICASSRVGDTLAANIKAPEFAGVLASCAGFIIEAINSKALYDRHAEFLSIEQAVITFCVGVVVVIFAENMSGLEMSAGARNVLRRHARQDLGKTKNCEKKLVRK